MDKITRFFECHLPTSQCNLECNYCYIIQEKRRKNQQIPLEKDAAFIRQALRKERLGGICFFSLCGTGETFLQKGCVELIHQLLLEGHYVNVTTNGTITMRLKEVAEFEPELLERLHLSFSFHYLELKKKQLTDQFFENVDRMKKAGCSILVQINLYDGYLPFLDEIKNLCKEKTGAFPQAAATRKEWREGGKERIALFTGLEKQEYEEKGKSFDSPLFRYTMGNFMVPRKEFCYAGEWSGTLDLLTGNLRSCYCSGKVQNIYKNVNSKIHFHAVGSHCHSPYCVNSSHFMSLGIIPEKWEVSYAELRNRKEAGWYSEKMEEFLSQKLFENHKEYSKYKKTFINYKWAVYDYLRNLKHKLTKYRQK